MAFLWTLISFDFARRVKGPRAPDLAILALLSSCVARLVMHPTALHWTSTFVDIIWRISGCSPPSWTIRTLFSADFFRLVDVLGKSGRSEGVIILLTARFPSAALAALWTSMSGFSRRNRMGPRVSRSTARTSEADRSVSQTDS